MFVCVCEWERDSDHYCLFWLTTEPCTRTELMTLWHQQRVYFNHLWRLWAIACLLAISTHEFLRMLDCACVWLCWYVSLIVCLCGGWLARQIVLWLLISCLSFRLTEYWNGRGGGTDWTRCRQANLHLVPALPCWTANYPFTSSQQ